MRIDTTKKEKKGQHEKLLCGEASDDSKSAGKKKSRLYY